MFYHLTSFIVANCTIIQNLQIVTNVMRLISDIITIRKLGHIDRSRDVLAVLYSDRTDILKSSITLTNRAYQVKYYFHIQRHRGILWQFFEGYFQVCLQLIFLVVE